MASKESSSASTSPSGVFNSWRGLGLWNFYFIAKLILFLFGYLQFDLFYNLLLLLALLVPLRPSWLHYLRNVIAIPFGIALLYYDSWFPPFRRLLEQPEVLQFSDEYLLDLLGRFINWQMIAVGVILFVFYLYLAKRIPMTLCTVFAVAVAGIFQLASPALSGLLPTSASNRQPVRPAASVVAPASIASKAPISPTTPVPQSAPFVPPANNLPLNAQLDNELDTFYATEKKRRVSFSGPPATVAPFDLLFLNICSLSWSDLQETGLNAHPFLKKMDIIFDEFNTATSYSGPAVSRLMLANCGQSSHAALYAQEPLHCSLFATLKSLGFDTEVALNHNGRFQGFIDTIGREKAFESPLIPTRLMPALQAFDGSRVWGDSATLDLWLKERNRKQAGKPVALLYNSITLHDGNKERPPSGRISPYEKRAHTLLDELDAFVNELERSGRRVAIIFVPEHGGSLKGDRMQISGMREIPTPDITLVPVGLRLVGAKSPGPATPVRVKGPTSFLAMSDLVSRLISQDVFDHEKIDWAALAAGLPQTRLVSENEGVVVMAHQGKTYIRYAGKDWTEYQP